MKLTVAQEMQQIDRKTIEEIGIPGIVLMEHAAQAVAEACLAELKQGQKKDTCILCGGGNNGGDGFAIARLLFQKGIPVSIFLAAEEEKLQGDAKSNYEIIKKLKIPVYQNMEPAEFELLLQKQGLLVDAYLGTGLTREIGEPMRTIIAIVNEKRLPVISVDMPTGIHTEDGSICGIAIKAKKTVTFAFGKPGLYLDPGAQYAGKVEIADIGIPKAVVKEMPLSYSILTDAEAAAQLPKRAARSNKGSFGKLFVVAGSRNMAGAALFAAKAGYLMGTGLIYACVPQGIIPTLQTALPEAVEVGLFEEEGQLTEKSLQALAPRLEKATAVVLGPGLGEGKGIQTFVSQVLTACKSPILLDADGLNAVANKKEIFHKLQASCIITPHPGEMSRLTGKTAMEILQEPVKTAAKFAREYQVITVLKDAHTIVANPDGKIFINTTGCSAMAKGGAGDVLSGMIGGLLAQGIPPYEAACLGVYCHGRTGELQAERRGSYSVLASDLLQAIPWVLKSLS